MHRNTQRPYPATHAFAASPLYRLLHIGDHYAQLGKNAEFVYSGSFWEPGLAYPGNQALVAAYEKGFNHAPSNQSAGHYTGCQLSVDAIGADWWSLLRNAAGSAAHFQDEDCPWRLRSG